MSLKRKKMWDQQVERLEGTMMTIETQINAIETATLNVETFKTYKMGTEALKQIHGEIDVDKVDDAVDDLREQMDIAEEISQAISQPIGGALLDDVRNSFRASSIAPHLSCPAVVCRRSWRPNSTSCRSSIWKKGCRTMCR